MGERPYVLTQIEPVVHIQSEAVTECEIAHDKNKPCPYVVLLDEYGEEFEAEIKYPDLSRIIIKMNVPTKFTAYIY